jgi:hypothetical protein
MLTEIIETISTTQFWVYVLTPLIAAALIQKALRTASMSEMAITTISGVGFHLYASIDLVPGYGTTGMRLER